MTTLALPYYNYDYVYSFSPMYACVVGGRGIGKTYGLLKRLIGRYINYGEEFIYLRRYKPEIVASKGTFFAAVSVEFPDYQFRVNGNVGQISYDGEKWETICYFAVLAVAQSYKGASFANVHTIVYDEFIIEKGHTQYLPNEVDVFDNFYLTVDRFQDRVTAFLLANSVSITNPYFIRFKVIPKVGESLVKRANGSVIFHFPDSNEFGNAVYKTRFGQYIRDSEYADYVVGNKFQDNNEHLLGNKGSEAAYMMTLKMSDGYFSVWHDILNGRVFVQEKRPKQERLITMDSRLMGDNIRLIPKTSEGISILKRAFSRGNMYFDNPRSRNAIIECFR